MSNSIFLQAKKMFKLPRKTRRYFSTFRFLELLIVTIILSYLIFFVMFRGTTKATSIPFLSITPKQVFQQTIGPSNNTTENAIGPNYTVLPSTPLSIQCPVTIAIILCEDNRYLALTKNKTLANQTHHQNGNKRVAKDFSRQINQTLVLLKSIAILSKYERKSCVETLLLTDKPNFYKLKTEMEINWPVDFRKFVRLTFIPVRYPPGSAWMKKMFRPCATLRLFLAELLASYDSVIYLDTDIIFFQSVQALWKQFERFDDESDISEDDQGSKKLAALAPCLFHYGSSANAVPYYGTSGLNAGIMLMNLTRMRGSQWTNKIRMVTTMFKDKIRLADQDILNIYFHFFPEELHVLTCDWNFRIFQCREGNTCEDQEIGQGISALHGNALSFTAQGPEPLFHSVFQTFHRTKLDGRFKLKVFVEQLESALLKAEENAHKYSSQCKQFGGLDVLLLNRLYSLVER